MDAVKIVGPTVANINVTPSSIGGAKLVRIYSATTAVITQTTAAAEAVGNITLSSDSVSFLIKSPTDLLSSSAVVSCTPIAYA